MNTEKNAPLNNPTGIIPTATGLTLTGKVNSPHDHLFRLTFSDKEKVKDFLQGVLPPELSNRLDLDELIQDPDSFVDAKLREHLADIVYQCKFGEEDQVEIAILFEHKTRQPDYPHVQLLRYTLNIWEKRIDNRADLQPVLPIIVYHGRKGWEYKPFEEYFGSKGLPKILRPFVPTLEYFLVDLRNYSDDEIINRFHIPTLRVTLSLMKYAWDPNIPEKLPFLLKELLEILDEEEWHGFLRVIIVYLHSTVKEELRPKVMEKIEEIIEEYTDTGVVVGSIAWADQQKGYELGLKAGIDQGVESTAKRALSKGFSIAETAELTGLNPEVIQRLKSELDTR